ncbi:MAG: DUF2141 domain-containing protein [Burkholderiaceae bacterium]
MPDPTQFTHKKSLHNLRMFCCAIALTSAVPAQATELLIRVTGIAGDLGRIGCALFASESGFPMNNAAAAATSDWLPASGDQMNCHFANVASGTYAVSVGHDTNGNLKVDTNFFGMPTEQWGVSNNVRPALRAPNFDEAKFTVSDDAERLIMTIEISK